MNNNRFILLTEKTWHLEMFSNLVNYFPNFSWFLINSKTDFNVEKIKEIEPKKIFIPHWSYIIPKQIYSNYECIVFHMTDLPFGRGGSPLQNLIVRGISKTKISALKVSEGLDSGDIYLKKKMTLDGSATDIFLRSNGIIEKMIINILKKNITPIPQVGIETVFKRRKIHESNIGELKELSKVYDYIRMLDAEGYPNAYTENKFLRFEFFNANFDDKNQIIAKVKIKLK